MTISFRTAEGLEAGKTKIRYKDVEVGLITTRRARDATTAASSPKRNSRRKPRICSSKTRGSGWSSRAFRRVASPVSAHCSRVRISASTSASRRAHAATFVGLEVPPTRHRRRARHALYAAQRRDRFARRRFAALLPARRRRPGRIVRARCRRPRRHAAGVRECAIRPVRDVEYALLACERRRHLARCHRSEGGYGVACRDRRRRGRVPGAARSDARGSGTAGDRRSVSSPIARPRCATPIPKC